MGRKGKETVRFGPDKKPRKCLSVPQAVYPYRKRFIRTTRVCLRRKRLPLAVFPANETPRV